MCAMDTCGVGTLVLAMTLLATVVSKHVYERWDVS